MPILKFQNPEGKTIQVDSPDGSMPNEKELDQLFEMSGHDSMPQQDQSLKTVENQNILGQLFNVPGAAITNMARGIKEGKDPIQSYAEGATQPSKVPTMLEAGRDAPMRAEYPMEGEPGFMSFPRTFMTGLAKDTLNTVIDPRNIVNPLTALGLSAETSLGKEVVKNLSITPAMQSFGKFLNKERNLPGHESRQVNRELDSLKKEFNVKYIDEVPDVINKKISSIKDNLKNLDSQFDNLINLETQSSAYTIKPKLREFNRSMVSGYGKKLDEFDNLIGSINRTANNQDIAQDLIEGSLNKVSNDSEAVYRIKKFAEDKGFVVNNFNDEAGDTFFRVHHPTEPEKPVTFRELVNWKQQFKDKNLSSDAKNNVGYKRQDHAYSAMQDSWGSFIKNQFNKYQADDMISKNFNELQEQYAPLANAKWRANKIFKPYDDEGYDTARGAKYLKQFYMDYQQGRIDIGRNQLLKMIENGNELSPGIGNITDRLKNISDNKVKSEGVLTKLITGLTKREENVNGLIKDQLEMNKKQDAVIKMLKNFGIISGGVGGTIAGVKALTK